MEQKVERGWKSIVCPELRERSLVMCEGDLTSEKDRILKEIFRDESLAVVPRRDQKPQCSLPVTRLFPFRMLSSLRLLKRSVVWSFAIMSCLFLFPRTSAAWIYPEHRDITVLAVQKLDPERRAILDRIWTGA